MSKVTVRVHLVVTTDGHWAAAASSDGTDIGVAYDCLNPDAKAGGEAEYTLVAEVDVPEQSDVVAEARRGK